MSAMVVGLLGVIMLLIFAFIGVPISLSMALAGFIGFFYLSSSTAAFSVMAIDVFSNFSSYSLTTIPMFVLMGCIAFNAGLSKRLFDAAYTSFGQRRGGLCIAAIVGCAGFAAICGSTAATAASMGKVALPEMKRFGYDDSIATGCLAAGGTLGILIPPSSTLVVYGVMTEQSIGKLLIAGILPGIFLALMFILAIIIQCFRKPSIAPKGPVTTLKQKMIALKGITEMLILFGFVIGGLFLGWFTPTQAGAAGAAGAIIIALVRRNLTWKSFIGALEDTILITGFVMLIVAGGMIFGRFITAAGIPFAMADYLSGLNVSPYTIMAGIILIHFAAGCVMDSFALIIITVPIFFPVIVALGFNPIWFGIIVIIIVEMGAITPPVGLNVFVIKGIAPDVPIGVIFKGVVPFIFAVIATTIVLTIFPQIATFLPSLM